jgi:hypothetical protein
MQKPYVPGNQVSPNDGGRDLGTKELQVRSNSVGAYHTEYYSAVLTEYFIDETASCGNAHEAIFEHHILSAFFLRWNRHLL